MGIFDDINEIRKEHITVGFLAEECRERFKLRPLNGEVGWDKLITDRSLHRPQLALTGYTQLFTFHRVQILGNTEIYYLNSMKLEKRIAAFRRLLEFDVPCLIVTGGNSLDPEILELATKSEVPIFATEHETTKAIYFLSDFLDDQFAAYAPVHAAFVDVYGVGLLIAGRSGIGKSEIALDLVERGHRLVADDVVMVTRKGEGILMGAGTRFGEHFMEVRGLGILNVREMFGIRAIRFQKRVEVIVELEEWDVKAEYTRTGLGEDPITLMDVELPHVRLPIFPGKNVTVIAEVIALNYLLRHYGYDASQVFSNKLANAIGAASSRKGDARDRSIPYFEHDFE